MTLKTGVAFILAGLSAWAYGADTRFSGVVGAEARIFTESALQGQNDFSGSLMIEPEWYVSWDNQSFTFKPFARVDSEDDERSHFDIRELYWQHVSDAGELTVGINKVYWGVAETQHLVDIINQTDLVENIDGEDKLGQPMIQWSMERDWGLLDLFVLPGFRERTFPGEDGRLRLLVDVDNDNALYESDDGDSHIDFAARWSQTLGDWDIGLSYFDGTSREPQFVTQVNNNVPVLVPYYPQISQIGLDLQATLEDWLWKLEVIGREGFGEDYIAAVGGFEYSTYGVFDSVMDIGWIIEYQFDDRDAIPAGFGQIEVSDIVSFGARLAFNDEQSTEFLLGLGVEVDNDAQFFSVEGNRRIGDDMKLSIEGRIFTGIDDNDPLSTFFYSYRKDDFIQITFEKFY
ncbi:hypothetical protein [Pleionea sp. CnH1-48]|uniref:hypothetical protein n=1 Tax=Pleionea sp. CnH1-48 TaxID=2954494 RepID=UPI002096BDFD|nr:hypothetical protein [Pleionea sp. CnH1-48]MCO7227209.1 hypothetical protein [Pleionea sp. CnH1-48]